MKLTQSRIDPYLLFSIEEDLTIRSDAALLRKNIKEALEAKERFIAFRFTPHSYLSTRAIANLVISFEEIWEHGGKVAVIDANEDILEVLSMIDLDARIHYAASKEELRVGTPEVTLS